MTIALPLAVVGVDFRTASTRWRSAMALAPIERAELHRSLRSQGGLGLAEIQTCNRTEWLAIGEDPHWVAELLRAQAIERLRDAGEQEQMPEPFTLVGDEAARHVLRVAVGLESLARGEQQISGQLHDAFARARQEQTACGVLNLLETVVGRTVRRASRHSHFRNARTGLHTLARDALRDAGLSTGDPVLVVGMGSIGRKVAATLEAAGFEVIAVNRSPRPGALALSQVLDAPPVHAGVVLCTAAPTPVWGAAQVRGPVVVVDIGSPGQAAAEVRHHPEARLIDLDQLVALRLGAARAAPEVEQSVDHGVAEFRRALGVRTIRDVIRTTQSEYQHLAGTAVPALLDGVAMAPADRQQLEQRLREMLRGYSNTVLHAMEELVLADAD